jgi:3'(2'), 5'-bisphosphate nucleotidase
VTEAGGIVTDADGKPLDFTLGRTLKANKYVSLSFLCPFFILKYYLKRGVVAAGKNIHARVLEAVKQARREAEASGEGPR